MKLLTQDDAKKKPEFRLALIGRSFARKSSLAAHFPRPGFLDADQNISRIKDKYPHLKFHYLQPQFDEALKPVPKERQWRNALAQLDALCAAPEVATIVIDSASALQEMIIDYILDQPKGKMDPLVIGGVKVLNQEQYRPLSDQFKELVVRCMACGKPMILTFHEQEQLNDRGAVESVWPLLTSRLRYNVTSMFTDAWRMTTRFSVQDAAHRDGVSYKLGLVPGNAMSCLGNSGQFIDASGNPVTEVEILFSKDSCNWDNTIGKAFPWLLSLR